MIEVFHKAFVTVDEQGTEAAAATAMAVPTGLVSPSAPPVEFFAGHPFLFVIRDPRHSIGCCAVHEPPRRSRGLGTHGRRTPAPARPHGTGDPLRR